jgi:hypothetical protein
MSYIPSMLHKSLVLLKKPKISIPLGVVLLVVLFTPISFYKQRSSYQCSGCISNKSVYQWYFGFGGLWGFPISPEWEDLKISRVCKDFAPANHKHNWVFAQGSSYRLGFIWYGCALGSGKNIGEMGHYYNLSEDFREYITEQENQKRLTHDQILNLLTLPSHPTESQTNNSAFLEVAGTYKKLSDKHFSQ